MREMISQERWIHSLIILFKKQAFVPLRRSLNFSIKNHQRNFFVENHTFYEKREQLYVTYVSEKYSIAFSSKLRMQTMTCYQQYFRTANQRRHTCINTYTTQTIYFLNYEEIFCGE